ncbi:MAG: phytanoyl-CoA dioxygenase family protein [Candidatus Poribacteria bacterium]
MILSEEQAKQWEEDGYLLLKQAISLPIIEGVRQLFSKMVDRIISELKSEGLVEDEGKNLPFETRLLKVAGTHANRFGRSWRNQVAGKAVYELHHAEPLVTAIGEITGTDVIGHPVFNARPKLPNQQLTVVPWHQDSGYFGAQSESALIPAAWIPLVPVDETNGCLQVVAGSHKIGLLNHHTEDREGQFLEILDSLIDESQIITCPMEMGDALLFHNLTLHRSTVHTTSNMIRWAIDIRYVRDDDDAGAIYWKDPDFKWVIRSQTKPITPLDAWLAKW